MPLKLSSTHFNKAREYIMVHGRELDQKLFEYHFEGGTKEAVLEI